MKELISEIKLTCVFPMLALLKTRVLKVVPKRQHPKIQIINPGMKTIQLKTQVYRIFMNTESLALWHCGHKHKWFEIFHE